MPMAWATFAAKRAIAWRALQVYNSVAQSNLDDALIARLRRYSSCGVWAGKIFCAIILWLHVWWWLLEWLDPAAGIDAAVDWPRQVTQPQQGGKGGAPAAPADEPGHHSQHANTKSWWHRRN